MHPNDAIAEVIHLNAALHRNLPNLDGQLRWSAKSGHYNLASTTVLVDNLYYVKLNIKTQTLTFEAPKSAIPIPGFGHHLYPDGDLA
jgi:hypothetical protein